MLHYDAEMRTTIDLPDDLHRIARAIANDSQRTMSETVSMLMRRGLGETGPAHVGHDPETDLPVVHLGAVVTSTDVAALDDDR
ncbi:antitoxin VapB29 [soil metagenome]